MINNYLDSFENYLTVENHKEIREELEASLLDQIEEKEEQLSRPLNKQEQEFKSIKFQNLCQIRLSRLNSLK